MMNRIIFRRLKGIKLISTSFNLQRANLVNVKVDTNTIKAPNESSNVVEEAAISYPTTKPLKFETSPLKPHSLEFPKDSDESKELEEKKQPTEYVDSNKKLEALRQSMPFDSMPGPQSIKIIAKMWKMLPLPQKYESSIHRLVGAGNLFGYLSWYNNIKLLTRMTKEYGPLVRLEGPFGGNIILLLRLEDALILIKNEGLYPVRSGIGSLEHYRLQYRKYKQAGLFLSSGPDWKKMRTTIESLLSEYLDYQFEVIEDASNEFVNRILRTRNLQDEVLSTFYREINKWSLECICSIILNKRLGFLEASGLNVSSEPARILQGVDEVISAIQRCEFGIHFWKYVNTPGWKNLVKYCDLLDTIFNKYIHKAQDSLKHKNICGDELTVKNISFLESLLLKEEISSEDTLSLILDMVILGSTATAYGVAFLLYHLSRYPNVQRKLYKEIVKAPDILTRQDLSNMPYLCACIKESLRLKQPIPILNRVLSEHSLIHNYEVPKDTHLMIPIQFYSLKEEYFEDPLKFKPERWLNDDLNISKVDVSTLPFGYGNKSCLAKALSEMQMGLAIIQILRKFRVSYQYGEVHSTNRMIAAPNRPLRFTFTNRE
ncbi:hypothetical protein FQR65_LT11875 [Abscondita terminalis]|nr:hypothetical protein FQR65_LT11875 [Abscondita terminalis]